MRTIKFRGKDSNGNWHYGDLEHSPIGKFCRIHEYWDNGLYKSQYDVKPATVGQYTGLTDKNGMEIYEGDILVFYELKTYCINPDCDPHLLGYSERLHKKTKAVRFEDGIFGVDGEYESIDCLAYLGEWASDEDYMEELKKDPYFDANGYDLDSIVGMEVVGNIHDNPELLGEKGGKQ